MSLAIGQVVGGYELISTIGAGGMGTVYNVRNAFTDRVDAMKVLEEKELVAFEHQAQSKQD